MYPTNASGHYDNFGRPETNNNNFQPQPPPPVQQQPSRYHPNGGDYGPLEIQCSSQPPQYYPSPMQTMEVDMERHSSGSYGPPHSLPPRRTVSFGGIPPPPSQGPGHQGFMPPTHCSPQFPPPQHHQPSPLTCMEPLPPRSSGTASNGYLHPHPSQPPTVTVSEPFDNFNNTQGGHYPPMPHHLPPTSHHQVPPPMRKYSYNVPPQHSGFLENYPPPHHNEIYRTHSTVTLDHRNHQPPSQPQHQAQNPAWRKMSLAPNFRMNSSYSTTTDNFEDQKPPPQRTLSQTLEYQKRKLSLRRFSSQLRTPKFSGSGNQMLGLTPYTPPPILSPIRNGSGLFCKIARKPSEFRKRSALFDMATDVIMEEDIPSASGHDSGIADDMDQGSTPEGSVSDEAKPSVTAPPPFIRPPIDNRANRPQRKNGLILSGQEPTTTGFAAELEALRKESAESSMSGKSMETLRYIQPRKCSMRASTSNDDVVRKMSSVSMDEPLIHDRKISTLSEAYYDYTPCESDITPHINLGKQFQARVKKWADREIMPHEREALPDRDECVFDCHAIEHLDEQTVAAYEALACSAAVPKIGHNKELALHILTENKGNIQAAVMDLLRSDTLDWEQYPIIFNYRYCHVDDWTPDDVQSFQDAIYKSEKDFHQVSNELGNRTVKDCIEFYYMWKKTCPDDYRKLRNLRRKRQLLEQQLDYPSVSKAPPFLDHPMEESTDEDIVSESESDIGTPMYASDRSPDEIRPAKMPKLDSPPPTPTERKTSMVRFVEPEKVPDSANGNLGLYPWLHAENGVFPSPSPSSVGNSAGTGQSYSQPPSVGAADLFEKIPSGFPPDILQAKIANIHRVTASKKGAQPSADGFFHCRLCDKRFEKVKSLNAHMKSHAMKARAEAEAQAQLQGGGSTPQRDPPPQPHQRSVERAPPNNNHLLGSHPSHPLDALNLQQQLSAATNSLPSSMAGSPMSLSITCQG